MVGISESDGGRTSVIGLVLCLVAAVCYAAGVVCQKLALRHAPAVQVTAFGCFTGTAACLPFAGQFLSQLGSAPVSATLQVVYLGLFPTTLGFTTWAYALARTPARGSNAAVEHDARSKSSTRTPDRRSLRATARGWWGGWGSNPPADYKKCGLLHHAR